MKNFILIIGLILSFAISASAQSTDNPTVEIFGGPSIMRNGVSAPSYSLYGGWQAEASFNFLNHIGLTTDFGGQYRSIRGQTISQYEYLFGPRFMARWSHATLFGHALVGANTLHVSGASTNGFAWGLGGGLDYNVSHRIAIRVIQADYLRTRLSNSWFNDARIGVGLVVKF
jgi:opacity protein-like surface antigen